MDNRWTRRLADASGRVGRKGNDVDRPYLAALLSYPVKSLAGGSHISAPVHPWGMAADRRWMVIDAQRRCMTQREHPRMAVLHAATEGDLLMLRAPGMVMLMVSPQTRAKAGPVTVWRDTVEAEDCGEIAASWMSTALDVPCRLVHMGNPLARKLAAAYAVRGDEAVSFADGFPVLLASETSLADLNARLATPVPMSRFRPNLVIAGAPPWAEDNWRRVRIGEVVFRVSKPCDRCIMTTIDQATGERPDGNEPLTTLGKFRRDISGKIMFAQNLVPENTGIIHVGDEVAAIDAGVSNITRAMTKA
jgi:uncharacterized protein YcbX